MKYILIGLVMGAIFAYNKSFFYQGKDKSITGKVEQLVFEQAGYKRSANRIIVFKPFEVDCSIAVDVSDNTFYNAKVGNVVNFSLNNKDVLGSSCSNEIVKACGLEETEFVPFLFFMFLVLYAFITAIICGVVTGVSSELKKH